MACCGGMDGNSGGSEQPEHVYAQKPKEDSMDPKAQHPNRPLEETNQEQFVNADIVEDSPLNEEDFLDEQEDDAEARAPDNNRLRALRQALTQHGYREEGGENCNKFSRYFEKGCQFWCADFVSWAFDSTGNKDRKLPWGNTSAVASIVQWAERKDKFVTHPQSGDVFTIQGGGRSHTGIVAKVEGDTFVTIEGNTTRPGRPGCVWVWGHRRRINGGYRFVRVAPPW